jgi:uncharacterized protein YkwD
LASPTMLDAQSLHTTRTVSRIQHRTYTPVPQPAPVTPAPQPQPTPDNSNSATQLESLVLQYTNDARRQNGLAPLANDSALVALARAHSADMLKKKYFSHKDLSGCNSTCRMNKSGYNWTRMGENIHMMSGYNMSVSDTARKIVNDWMNSPSHKANILNKYFTNGGIGVAQSGSTIYTTAEYATQK